MIVTRGINFKNKSTRLSIPKLSLTEGLYYLSMYGEGTVGRGENLEEMIAMQVCGVIKKRILRFSLFRELGPVVASKGLNQPCILS